MSRIDFIPLKAAFSQTYYKVDQDRTFSHVLQFKKAEN